MALAGGLANLARMSLQELETLYTGQSPAELPWGRFEGKLLRWHSAPEARHPVWRPMLAAMFQLAPFGVDFDRRCWFFVNQRMRTGRFEVSLGASKWRPTQAFRLRYDASGLPRSVRGLLYDELKPLSEDLCLGIGGLNLSGQPAAVFFFGLERQR